MRKKHTGAQIVAKLRQADVRIGQGKTVPEVCKEIEVSEQTYCRWRQKYGGMSPAMVRELRGLQRDNAQLRKVVTDLVLNNRTMCLRASLETSRCSEDVEVEEVIDAAKVTTLHQGSSPLYRAALGSA